MKIVILKKVHDKERDKVYAPGDVVDVTAKRAEVFISGGYAQAQATTATKKG